MRKIVLFSLLIAFLTVIFQSCKKSTLGITRVTTYPELEIIGETYIVIAVGSEYEDEGAIAFIGDTEVEYTTVGVVNPDQPGFYNINYKAVNEEGFSITKTRTVVVVETGLVSGLYDGIRSNRGAGGPVLIYNTSGSNYFISDIMGGWYEFALGYGNAYAAPAIINVDTDAKTFSIVSGSVSAFGPSAVSGISISDDFSVWEYTQTLTDFDFPFPIKLTKAL